MNNIRQTALIALTLISTFLYSHENVFGAHFPHPIDIVYLWVDGNDLAWQAIKDHFANLAAMRLQRSNSLHEAKKLRHLLDASTNNRFMDNEELRYSLRSICQYAPFINHIYIVTMNQRPAWLARHPQITIIDHTEIFRNSDDLPTFNSHAIESNLHRIPNLAEFFIYFNDDVFLGSPVTPFDFFINEQPNVLFEKGLSPSGPPLPHETAYRRAWRNTNNFLDMHYKKEPRHRLCHAPFALRKSYIEGFELEFPEIFELNSSHKFRSENDFNVTNGLLQYYWLYHGKIASQPLSNMMVSLRDDSKLSQTKIKLAELREKQPITFCLQDVMGDNSAATKELLRHFLEEYYPEPAPWEKE